MKFFDSHCHLQFDAFDEIRDQIIHDIKNDNSKAINVGSSIENSRSSVLLSKKFSDCLYSSVGVHPFHSLGFEIYGDTKEAHDSMIKYPQDLNVLKELINLEDVKAIGECGIDFSYFKDLDGSELDIENWKQKQIGCFKFQIELAKEYNLPLILHIRKEYKLALDILNELQFKGKAVFHFFKGKYSDFEEIFKNDNYFFGFSGIITYDDTMDKIIKEVPLERLLIETDSPYVAPVPFRGELNQPKYVIKVAEKISMLKELQLEDVLGITYDNTIKFFNI